MHARSLSKMPALFALGIATLVACGTAAPDSESSAEALSHVVPQGGAGGGGKPLPPIVAMPTSFNLGNVGAFDDPMGGIRRGQVSVVVPTTGTLNAFFSTLTDEWRITSIQWANGSKPPVTLAPFTPTVTAGDHLLINFEFVANFADATGAQNSQLFLNNGGSVLLIPVTINEGFFYPAAAVLDVYVSLTCGAIGADGAIQLGEIVSGCPSTNKFGVENLFEFNVVVENLGNVAGTFTAPFTAAGFDLGCGQYTASTQTVAPGQVFTMACEGSVAEVPGSPWTAKTGLTYPITVGTSVGTRNFGYTVDVVVPPSSTGSGSSSGGGSSGPTCSQSGDVCNGISGDKSSCLSCKEYCPGTNACTALGTFCTQPQAVAALNVPCENRSACCGDQCDVYNVPSCD